MWLQYLTVSCEVFSIRRSGRYKFISDDWMSLWYILRKSCAKRIKEIFWIKKLNWLGMCEAWLYFWSPWCLSLPGDYDRHPLIMKIFQTQPGWPGGTDVLRQCCIRAVRGPETSSSQFCVQLPKKSRVFIQKSVVLGSFWWYKVWIDEKKAKKEVVDACPYWQFVLFYYNRILCLREW